jgi:Protein of unknown function (DUF2380)
MRKMARARPKELAQRTLTARKRRGRLAKASYPFFCALFALAPFAAARAETPAPAAAIAILDFEYRDTSGEPGDQTAEHAARLHRFMDSLRSDLAKSGQFRVVAVTCEPNPCSLETMPATEVVAKARQAHAHFAVFGEIHKISTLIQLGNFHVVNVETNTSVIDRILSFRGDSDEAWRRAEGFVVKELRSGIYTD